MQLWLAEATTGDFAIDAYVPRERHELVRNVLIECGYMPVTLYWERVGTSRSTAEDTGRHAETYYRSLLNDASGTASDNAAVSPFVGGAQGFVDDIEVTPDRFTVRGWAVDESGALPKYLSVRVGGRVHILDAFERQLRPDVQRHLGLGHALCGYIASVPLDRVDGAKRPESGFELRAGNDKDRLGPSLPLAGPLAQRLRGRL